MKFLIVDDSKAMQRIVTKTLRGGPFKDAEYLYAFNGKEALDVIEEHQPDMVLTDWHMPEMSGLELLLNVQKNKPEVKVGVLTTDKSAERVEEAKKAGALFYVCKPFTPETVHSAIMDAIESKLSDIKEHKKPPKCYIVPNKEAIGKAISDLSGTQVTVTELTNAELDFDHMPFLIGMYDDDNDNTRVVIVLDVAAVCLVGAAIENMSADEILLSVKRREIPEQALVGAKSLLNVLGSLFYDDDKNATLHFDVLHVVSKPVEKFRNFLEKKAANNVGMRVNVEGYGKGSMLLIQH